MADDDRLVLDLRLVEWIHLPVKLGVDVADLAPAFLALLKECFQPTVPADLDPVLGRPVGGEKYDRDILCSVNLC
jgi:hypothetical protein